MYIPPSQNSYYPPNYYNQGYGQPNYIPASAPHNYYPNGGYGNPHVAYPSNYQNPLQPLRLDAALNKSSYSSTNRDIVLETILDCFSDKNENKVYLQSLANDKIFVINKTLNVKLVNKVYNVSLIINIPSSFPNTAPEFYIHKKPKVGINKAYYENENIININTFQINTDKICPYNPSKNNVWQIIATLKMKFNNKFPIFAAKSDNINQPPAFGPNNPDFRRMTQVIVESDKMTKRQVLELVRKQVKDDIIRKYKEFNNKYQLCQSYNELKTINDITNLQAGNSLNGNKHPMIESRNVLNNIKQRLINIENDLNYEIQTIGNSNKTALEKCDELIKIKDDEDMRLLIMKKVLEDYLVYLKKGYEKKLVSFNDMVNQTRELSREIFSIDYLRTQRKKY